MTSKEALEHIIFEAKAEKPIFSMYYQEFLKPIEQDLDRLEKLEKAFDTLSKDDEKAKKLLSLEIEKNRKLQIIEEKFDIEVFETKSLDGKVKYIIDIISKPNKYSNISENSLTKEEYDLFKEKLENE